MLLRLVHLVVTNLFAALRLLAKSDHVKVAEILALRHQLGVLERQLGGRRAPFHWFLQWAGVLFTGGVLLAAFCYYWLYKRHHIGTLAAHAAPQPPANADASPHPSSSTDERPSPAGGDTSQVS